jgi:Lipoprotein LpqB beta-propeller domain/Sporulation and spore germination
VRRACVLAAALASVAGCVGMPSNGPVQQPTASATSAAPDLNLVGPHPSGPQPGADPSQIVRGFLLASASYPTYPVAQDYLVSSAIKAWKPGWAVTVFSRLNVPDPVSVAKSGHTASPQVTVEVTGSVQASFDGTGQYVSAQNQGQAGAQHSFTLVKVDGQWRITNPPNFRMLLASDFPLFYKAQDLYFVDPQDQVLVPDSVFVPLGTTVSEVLDNLVRALIEGPATAWLEGAADTELPARTRLLGVTAAGPTATVNLAGPSLRTSTKTQLFAAQLVWTLTGSLPNIQSVVLEINGQPWTPRTSPCSGYRNPGSIQTQAAYECFDPFPSSPASFYYVDGGQLWARCGNKSQALQGLIGPVEPLVGRPGALTTQRCQATGFVHEGSTLPPAAQPESLPALSMAAVSPDGRYLAVVGSGNGAVYFGTLAGGTAALLHTPRLTGGGVTALSFDGNDDLWVAQSGAIWMLPPTGKSQVLVPSNGSVTDLSIAPDGVRIAFVSQASDSSPPSLYLAAIGGGQQNTSGGQLGPAATHTTLRQVVSLGPNLSRPASLAWYDADELVVLNAAPGDNTLWDVPVDGQQAQMLQITPSGVTSITADGDANVLVAGLSGNNLEVSTSLEGPWYQLGNPGQSPAYPG